MRIADLRSLPEADRNVEAVRLAVEDVKRPMDLQTGPLVRALLVRMGEEQHRLYMTLHHLVFDAVSIYGVFLPELEMLYEAFSTGNHPRWPSQISNTLILPAAKAAGFLRNMGGTRCVLAKTDGRGTKGMSVAQRPMLGQPLIRIGVPSSDSRYEKSWCRNSGTASQQAGVTLYIECTGWLCRLVAPLYRRD